VPRQVNHHVFVIEREFTHTPALVFFAWTNADARRQWFRGPEDWVVGEQVFDFRTGGQEISEAGPKGGFVSRYESRILEIVPDERIITAFMMYRRRQSSRPAITARCSNIPNRSPSWMAMRKIGTTTCSNVSRAARPWSMPLNIIWKRTNRRLDPS